jgi:hypothetical protein
LIHSPSGTAIFLTPGVLVIRGGNSFCSQLIPVSFQNYAARRCIESSALRMTASQAPARSAAPSGGPASISWINRLPITTASASGGNRLRACRIANAEADADGKLHVLADLGELRAHLCRVDMCRAGDAFERNIVDVTARELSDRGDSRLGRGRREQEDRRDAVLGEPLSEFDRLFGRIVDDEHAVDARLARAVGKCGDAHRLDRIRIAHEHDRRRIVALAKRPHHVQHGGEPDTLRQRALGGALDNGPSAIGSENGTPSSITSAPAATSADRIDGIAASDWVARRHVRYEPRASRRRGAFRNGGVDAIHAGTRLRQED